nr:EOG090X0MTI [Lepidurus arcticus]
MAASNRYQNVSKFTSSSSSKNPFLDDDDDVDDETFLAKAPSSASRFRSGGGESANYKYSSIPDDVSHPTSPLEDKRMALVREKERVEQETLASTQRSLGLLYETEQVGTSTAEELLHQKELLRNTERKLDEMNVNLRASDKHIQNIKSVFSSIKNYFSKGPELPKTQSSPSLSNTSSLSMGRTCLPKAVERSQDAILNSESPDHPGLRIRGFTEDSRDSSIDSQLDKNLDLMGHSLLRLKGLALGLEEEVDDQNALLDRISASKESASLNLSCQMRSTRLLLEKVTSFHQMIFEVYK